MINRIHKDHANMMQLLEVMDNKVALLKSDQSIDYYLLKSITDYLKNYAEKYHHSLEDIIYSHYLKYRVVSNQVANHLVDDHQQLAVITKELDDMLSMILLDAIIPKMLVIDKLDEFIIKQRQHIIYEETSVLPIIEASFTEDDWAHLNLQWQHKEYSDPLFGNSVSERFKSLSLYIN